MKKFSALLIIALAMGISASAQNIIVTNEGESIKAYNLELAGSSIFYQTSTESNAPIQKMSKADILIIKMEDGTKVDPNASEQPQQGTPAPQIGSIVPLNGNAASENARQIAEFNRELTWEPDEKFLKKHQGKIGNGYAGIMWVSENSQLYNGDVTISYQRVYDSGASVMGSNPVTDYRSNIFVNPMVIVKVKNNTDRMIYLDLASCFVICGEDSTPYFVPVTTTVSNTNTSSKSSEYVDVKVSDDKVKASDHTYVSGSTSSVTSVKEAQQYLSVAPKATLSLEPMPICSNGLQRSGQMYSYLSSLYLGRSVFPFENTPYGEVLDIDEQDSPFQFGSCVTYSFNPDHSDVRTIRTELYLKYVMCTSSTALFAYTIEGDFHKRYPFWVPFYVSND